MCRCGWKLWSKIPRDASTGIFAASFDSGIVCLAPRIFPLPSGGNVTSILRDERCWHLIFFINCDHVNVSGIVKDDMPYYERCFGKEISIYLRAPSLHVAFVHLLADGSVSPTPLTF